MLGEWLQFFHVLNEKIIRINLAAQVGPYHIRKYPRQNNP